MSAQVKELERQLIQRTSNLQEINKLYAFCESDDLQVVFEALQAIAHVLRHHRGDASPQNAKRRRLDGDSKKQSVDDWLEKHTSMQMELLGKLAASNRPQAQVASIRLAMSAIREDHCANGIFADRVFQNFMTEVVLASKWGDHIVRCLIDEFVEPYLDVRHHLIQHLRFCVDQVGSAEQSGIDQKVESVSSTQNGTAQRAAKQTPRMHLLKQLHERGFNSKTLFLRTFGLLRAWPAPSVGASTALAALPEATLVRYGKEERRLFQEAWLSLLKMRPPLNMCRPLLQHLPEHVFPHLSQPLCLSDFYLNAFNRGSLEVRVLSLSGLFALLTQHGLGDPELLDSSTGKFYDQLYYLVRPEVFALPRRARFQRLLAASLASGLLPARFAGAFAKKCLRTALLCEDAGAVMWLVSISYRTIQTHHTHCRQFLHNHEGTALEKDPFDAEIELEKAVKEMQTTSFWELEALRQHRNPAITRLCGLFLNSKFFKPSALKLNPDDFLDLGAGKLYEQELKTSRRRQAKSSEPCPVAFKLEEEPLVAKVLGWACVISEGKF